MFPCSPTSIGVDLLDCVLDCLHGVLPLLRVHGAGGVELCQPRAHRVDPPPLEQLQRVEQLRHVRLDVARLALVRVGDGDHVGGSGLASLFAQLLGFLANCAGQGLEESGRAAAAAAACRCILGRAVLRLCLQLSRLVQQLDGGGQRLSDLLPCLGHLERCLPLLDENLPSSLLLLRVEVEQRAGDLLRHFRSLLQVRLGEAREQLLTRLPRLARQAHAVQRKLRGLGLLVRDQLVDLARVLLLCQRKLFQERCGALGRVRAHLDLRRHLRERV